MGKDPRVPAEGRGWLLNPSTTAMYEIREEMTPFDGCARLRATADPAGRVVGRFLWRSRHTPMERIEGEFEVPLYEGHIARPEFFNPFRVFPVRELQGRAIVLDIPGVGKSPVSLFCRPDFKRADPLDRANGRTPGPYFSYPLTVRFRATSGPVPILTLKEIAEALRTPIFDALEGAGEPGLARIALAAAAALAGFKEGGVPSKA
jgi:hypothetical protein